jgi:DNA (cytosine-5)-methyltransferase 1
MTRVSLHVLEFFSGLGGWREALGAEAVVAAAYDISPLAVATYELNHGHRPITKELAAVSAEEVRRHGADTWAMSPPCQPFCRMGNRRDLEDPRSRAFLHLMDLFAAEPPERLVLESVEGFLGSGAHALLTRRLEEAGFHRLEFRLCPTQFGIPNLRPRAFVVASRRPLAARALPVCAPGTLAPYLDAEEDPALYLPPDLRHLPGLDLVRRDSARTACFIGGYGQRFVGGGSFLETERGIRRFSVAEVARLLGWPTTPRFPEALKAEARYKLLGNGLSLPVARWVAQLAAAPPQPHPGEG